MATSLYLAVRKIDHPTAMVLTLRSECTGGMAISGENKAMDPMAPRLHTASV